ncbi:hypothetical protein P3T25_009201 [Paraburkholderia sp. GAS32]
METDDVPEDFPRDKMPGVVPGARPKICAVRFDNLYSVGQTTADRHERWLICEYLAAQLLPIARRDAAEHPNQSHDPTLQRVRAVLSRKAWV